MSLYCWTRLKLPCVATRGQKAQTEMLLLFLPVEYLLFCFDHFRAKIIEISDWYLRTLFCQHLTDTCAVIADHIRMLSDTRVTLLLSECVCVSSPAVPFKLQEGEVRIISVSQCQSYFDMKTITSRMLCAGYEAGTIDSCMVSVRCVCVCVCSRDNMSVCVINLCVFTG